MILWLRLPPYEEFWEALGNTGYDATYHLLEAYLVSPAHYPSLQRWTRFT